MDLVSVSVEGNAGYAGLAVIYLILAIPALVFAASVSALIELLTGFLDDIE